MWRGSNYRVVDLEGVFGTRRYYQRMQAAHYVTVTRPQLVGRSIRNHAVVYSLFFRN